MYIVLDKINSDALADAGTHGQSAAQTQKEMSDDFI